MKIPYYLIFPYIYGKNYIFKMLKYTDKNKNVNI